MAKPSQFPNISDMSHQREWTKGQRYVQDCVFMQFPRLRLIIIIVIITAICASLAISRLTLTRAHSGGVLLNRGERKPRRSAANVFDLFTRVQLRIRPCLSAFFSRSLKEALSYVLAQIFQCWTTTLLYLVQSWLRARHMYTPTFGCRRGRQVEF